MQTDTAKAFGPPLALFLTPPPCPSPSGRADVSRQTNSRSIPGDGIPDPAGWLQAEGGPQVLWCFLTPPVLQWGRGNSPRSSRRGSGVDVHPQDPTL